MHLQGYTNISGISQKMSRLQCISVQVEVFKSEQALLEAFVEATQSLDPDIVLGFEVQKGSLGYLADRAATMEMALLKLVSRTPEVYVNHFCHRLILYVCASASALLRHPCMTY